MKLIPDWKDSWKFYSQRIMAAAVAVQATWVALPDDMRASVPPDLVTYGTLALLGVGILGRIIDQNTDKVATDA